MPISGIFETFSVDFAGPLPRTLAGNIYILIGIEHLSGWPLAQAYAASTSEEVINFIRSEIIRPFGIPQKILSDNAQCFVALSLREFAGNLGIKWKYVSPYAAQANGKVERFVGTLKRSILRTINGNPSNWDKAIPNILYGYRRRRQSDGLSPFELIYGTQPRLTGVDPVSFIEEPAEEHRRVELLAYQAVRASRRTLDNATESNAFSVGDKVLVAHGQAMGPTKWPSLVSKWYGPCKVIAVDHPRYHLRSTSGRKTRKPVHVRRLRKYVPRNEVCSLDRLGQKESTQVEEDMDRSGPKLSH
jgi:Integrase core domain